MTPTAPAPAPLTRWTSRAIGLFICVELIYLPLSNCMLLVPREVPPAPDELYVSYQEKGRVSRFDTVQAVPEGLGRICDRYGEFALKPQGWALFAPTFGGTGVFLTLHVEGADGAFHELPSRFEPADPSRYLQLILKDYRLFYRELPWAMIYSSWRPGMFESHGEEFRDGVAEVVHNFRKSMWNYVRWRLKESGLDPAGVSRVNVMVRAYPPREPGDTGPRPAPQLIPLARWHPDRPGAMEPWNPVTGQFDAAK